MDVLRTERPACSAFQSTDRVDPQTGLAVRAPLLCDDRPAGGIEYCHARRRSWRLVDLGYERTWGPYTIPAAITVTRQGVWGGIVFVSRVAASVSFAVLFTLTTRWGDVFSGLRSLFVPRVFIVTLSMTYRYLFVFLRLVQDMYRARKSRTIRPLSGSEERNWTASRIGVTFRKSLDMSEDIYRAMLSRGFRGEFRSISRFHPAPADYIWLVTVLLFGGILIMFEKGLV